MEDKDKKENMEDCNCMLCKTRSMMHGKMCCGWGGHRHSFLRIVLLLVILAIVFSVGVKLGEFKSEFRGSQMEKGYYGGFHSRQIMMYPEVNCKYGITPGCGNNIPQSSTTPR
jgi:hypothetical protein